MLVGIPADRLPPWSRALPFRQLLATRLASQAADGVFEAALAGYVLFSPDRAADAGTIAVGLAVVLLPFSVVGPFVGVILDRVDRRRTLTAGGFLRAGIALLAALVLSTGGGSAGLVVLAIALLACSRLVLSGVSAALPLVVADGNLVAAGGFSTTAGTAATGVGAALGGGVRALAGASDHGLAVVALVAAGAYAAGAVVTGRAQPGSWGPPPSVPGRERRRLMADLRLAGAEVAAGAQALWSRRRARNALIAVNAGRIGYGIVFISTLLLLRSRPGHPSGTVLGLGGVVAGLALGTVAGAVIAPRLARLMGRPAVVTLGLCLGGAGAVLATPAGSRLLLVCVSPVLGLGQQIAKVSSDALIQIDVADESRGRAFTIVDMAFSVTYVGAAGMAAACVPATGRAPVVLALAGGSWLLSGVVHAFASGRSRPAVR